MGGLTHVEVEGSRYSVRFDGFSRALGVRTDDGRSVELAPWSLGEHLQALEQCIDDHGRAFDADRLARHVLARAAVPPELVDELAPLAVWWASGGGTGPQPDDAPWLRTGAVRVRLRPWTARERAQALAASVTPRPDGGQAFHLARYLRAMLRASVVAVDPPHPGGLEALDGASAVALIEAVVAENLPDRRDDPSEAALNRVTLRLCAALGWTPSQVWATPAPEVERLLTLLDRSAPPPSPHPPARPPRFIDQPDVILIEVEDG